MENLIENKKKLESFSDLIYPIHTDDFNENYWEKKVLHIQRDNSDFFSSLFSLEDLDKILEYSRPRGGSLRVVKSQQPLNASIYENHDGSLNLNQLYAAYADGYTIVINEVQRFWDPIKAFIQNIRQQLGHNLVGNLYLTPENEKALSPHYDAHDVFALQISGEKHWILYDDDNYKTPLLNSFQPIFQREQLTGAREITLKAGDIMYIPRGVPHEAYTTDKSSMHITFGVHPTQWVDFLTKSLTHLAQTNIELRRALPIGFLHSKQELFSADFELDLMNIVQKMLTKENVEGALNIIEEEFRTKEQPKPDGHFAHLDKINRIDTESYLQKREGVQSKVVNHFTGARIIFQGNTIKGPSQLAPTLEFISEQHTAFQVKDIPFINDENRLKLAKRLIRGGLLRIVE